MSFNFPGVGVRFRSRRQRTTSTGSAALPPPVDSESSSPEPFPPDQDGSNNTLSNSDYARKCRKLMDLYRSLRSLGIEMFLPDLPRVVVIGGQSSGKSSLVEAVSGINVPRDSGTCTRCPMECTMSSDATSWSCTISIRTEYDTQGRSQAHQSDSFGPAIENKSEVELWIRRAQAAVLSPHRPRSDFLTMGEEELRRLNGTDLQVLKFSKNVVEVSVKDPEATDLAFVDLPGLIQNVDDVTLIDTVQSLVEKHIGQKNTLIVIAMPMSDDIENILAARLARSADPNGERTIGVLTKPDTIGPGSTGLREKWKAVLEGTEHHTTHGYYCVRLAHDEERARRLSKAESKRIADGFFNTTTPWCTMGDRSRFGIPNFVTNVSALLVKLIETNLPDLREIIELELLACLEEIEGLPLVSRVNPSTEVMLRVTAFCKAMKDAVFGEGGKHFVQANKRRYARFKNDISMTTPDFRPFDSTVGTRSLVTTHTEPRSLVDVRNVIKSSITWELPRHIPFEATKTLVSQYTSLWEDPSFTCFDDIVNELSTFLDEQLQHHFKPYEELKRYISVEARKDQEQCRDDARKMLQKILQLESDPLFTQNLDTLRQEENNWNTRYLAHRGPSDSPRVYKPGPPAPITHSFTPPQDLEDTPCTWEVEDEIKVMANVMGYFQIAYKRIIDYVPLIIEHELNQTFASKLSNVLIDKIFQDSRDGKIDLERLLREDPVTEAKRKTLEDMERRLRRIKQELDDFERSSVA